MIVCTGSADATVVVNEVPDIHIYASPDDGCEDLFVQFSANFNPTVAFYNWFFSDGTTLNQPSPSKIFINPGIYDATLYVISADDCENSILEADIVEVYELPVSNFIVNSNLVSMDNPIVTFTDLSTSASTYCWDFGDFSSNSNYSADVNPAHTFSHQGEYIVWQTVYIENGCSDESYTLIHVELNMFLYH